MEMLILNYFLMKEKYFLQMLRLKSLSLRFSKEKGS